MRVAVVGAGVIGLTSAFALKQNNPELQVTIFADIFTPNTTGDGSAGLWGPFLLGDTSKEDISKWAGKTHRLFEQFWKSGLAKEVGLCLLPTTRVTSETNDDLSWLKLVYGVHHLTKDELTKLNKEHKSNYINGWHFVTYTCEPTYFLPWLTNKFVALGGELKRRKIRDLGELIEDGYEIVINCSGLGARELVNDDTMTAVRGQVSRVKAPWVMHCILVDDDHCNYIIPNINNVVLGGTHQENDYDLRVRDEDSKFIYEGCHRMIPSLKKAEIIKSWVGLRPGRPKVRLESEIYIRKNGKKCHVIHNYGHGGAGLTLSWGCALDVVEIVQNLNRNENQISKL
ncbi:D-amino-acid oxidase [Polistes fuscatus]|uniref:D-amino-acid oxidase n=1 Tax=Polistes fuscatus TaxID=30207 RepID=UPI001CA8EB0A|nr:D-amino-acid oxidase [Polistes fuscatus]XP_043487757.1 D-amino-acid oxidase [Polistes fuscatus]